MITSETHNKKSLAFKYNLTYKQLLRKLQILLSDNDVAAKFGKYKSPFTPKQLSIISDEWGDPVVKS